MKEINYEQKRKIVEIYYRRNEFVLINMNDYDYHPNLGASLTKDIQRKIKANGLTVDMGSSLFHTTEHFDVWLGHNLTLEELDRIRFFLKASTKEEAFVEEGFKEEKIQKWLEKIYYREKEMKGEIGIGDLIRQTKEPLILYTVGASNLMRVIGTHPELVQAQFEDPKMVGQNIQLILKCEDPNTYQKIGDAIKRNFENIYQLNPNAKVFVPSIRMAKGFEDITFGEPSIEYMDMDIEVEDENVVVTIEQYNFLKTFVAYNEVLEKVCKEYGANYLNLPIITYPPQHLSGRKERALISKAVIETIADYLKERCYACPKELEEDPIEYYDKDTIIERYEDAIQREPSNKVLKEEKKAYEYVFRK